MSYPYGPEGQPMPGAGYGQPGPGGFPPPPPPLPPVKKSNTGLIIGISGGAVLLLCVGVVVVLFVSGVFGGSNGSASSRAAAETYLNGFEERNSSQVSGVLCDRLKSAGLNADTTGPAANSLPGSNSYTFEYTVTGDEEVSSTEYRVSTTITFRAAGADGYTSSLTGLQKLDVYKENDGWKVCSFDDSALKMGH